MRASPLIAASLVLAGLPAVATAAPARKPPICRQIVDVEGDGKVLGALDSQSVDILSADLATGRKNLVAVIRTKSSQRESFLVGGRTFVFEWTVGGATQTLRMIEWDSGERAGFFDADGSGNGASPVSVPVVVDPNASVITWTVGRKMVAALAKPAAKFTGLKVLASDGRNFKALGTTGNGTADTATSAKTYTDLTPTCLKGT